jgi:Homeodomain-like domain
MRKIERISVSPADGERMERLVRDRNTPQKVVWRARIVLLASDGMTATAIAAAAGKSLLTVRRWRRRYAAAGVDGFLKPVAEITCNRIRRGEDAVVTARRGVCWSPVARRPDEERYRTQISATARQRGAARARGKDGGPIAVERRSQTKIAPPVPPPPRCEQTA